MADAGFRTVVAFNVVAVSVATARTGDETGEGGGDVFAFKDVGTNNRRSHDRNIPG
jgi:hypothetical protein